MTTPAEYRALLVEALPVLNEYARDNPKWYRADHYGGPGQLQDPNGIHALLPRITAALADDSNGWMPIETAPKNHLPILVYGPYGRLVAFRDVTWAWWPVPASEKLDYTPTHWQPLPNLPERKV